MSRSSALRCARAQTLSGSAIRPPAGSRPPSAAVDPGAGLDEGHVVARVEVLAERDPDQLARLDGAALERLNKEGLLDVAVFAAASLGTMQRLIARKQRKLAAGS